MAESTAAFRIGDRLNQYELLRVLGQGGHSVVFHGHDRASARDVAIKVIQNPKHDLKLRARAEADLLISLRHPHVVEVYDAGIAEDGSVYIVMEKLEGKSLREILVRLQKLTVLEALPIGIQIASGVLSAHARKVVHRDLKPDNVFVRPDGTVKVLDFGIAKYLERGFDTTQKRMWQGTPSYMAPEQFQGLPVSYRSDVFALGVVLYELIGGIKPSHVGGEPTSVEQFAIRQLAVDPPLLHKLDSSVPASVSRMIRRAIAKVPEDRFEMEEFLKKMQSELQSERRRSGRAAPRDLVRACMDMTDPDWQPAFTAFSQCQTRSGEGIAHDATVPDFGVDGSAAAPASESQARLVTERLVDAAPQPTRTAPPRGEVASRAATSAPVLSARLLGAARPPAALRGSLLMSAAVFSSGLLLAAQFAYRADAPDERPPHPSVAAVPSAAPVAPQRILAASPGSTTAAGPVGPPASATTAGAVTRAPSASAGPSVARAAASAPSASAGPSVARAEAPAVEGKPLSRTAPDGKTAASVTSVHAKASGSGRATPGVQPALVPNVGSGLGPLQVRSGLTEETVPRAVSASRRTKAASGSDSDPGKDARKPGQSPSSGKLWFPPK